MRVTGTMTYHMVLASQSRTVISNQFANGFMECLQTKSDIGNRPSELSISVILAFMTQNFQMFFLIMACLLQFSDGLLNLVNLARQSPFCEVTWPRCQFFLVS